MHVDELFPRQAELAHVRRVLEGTEKPNVGPYEFPEPRAYVYWTMECEPRPSFVMRNLQ